MAAMGILLLCVLLPVSVKGTGETMLVEAKTGTPEGHAVITGDGENQWVEGFHTAGEDGITMEIAVSREGFYDIAVVQASQGGHKENPVLLDGRNIGSAVTDDTAFGKSVLEHIYLSAGSHTLGIGTNWGYIRVDRFELLQNMLKDYIKE